MRALAAAALLLSLGVTGAVSGQRVHIPRPTDVVAPAPPPPEVEPSRLDLPVTVSLDAIAAAVAEAIPAERDEEESWLPAPKVLGRPGLELQYYLWRGEPEVRAVDDGIEIRFPELGYRAQGRLGPGGESGTCGYGGTVSQLSRLTLTLATRLDWADDGTVRSETTIVKADAPEPCRLGALDVDVTPFVRGLMEEGLPALTQRLDAAVQAHSLSARRLGLLWGQIARPVELRERLWVTLSPSAIAVSPIIASADGKSLATSISVAIAPRAVKGAAPSVKPPPLPRIERSGAGAAGDAGGAGCHLAIPVAVPFDEINAVVRQQVVGVSFDVGPLGSVWVISTLLYGSGDRLAMEVGVEGMIKGKIYAIGKPVLDADALLFHIEDIDLSVESRNVLLKAADTFAKDHLIAALENATRFELTDRIEASRRGFEERLNREIVPGIAMRASGVKITPRGVYPAAGGIEVQTVLDAAIELAVQ